VGRAAATLHEPQLLMLDEPTSAVDPQSRRDFWESLFALVARGATILVSTHYMDEAERCHRIAILSRGRLVAEGPPQQLMSHLPLQVIEVESGAIDAARRVLHEHCACTCCSQRTCRARASGSWRRCSAQASTRVSSSPARISRMSSSPPRWASASRKSAGPHEPIRGLLCAHRRDRP
jgi:ABC-type multidrug transport system ATPase subunit